MRTGMFALGCFPFILAFGAKWNLVTFVTGYSHEKLQVSALERLGCCSHKLFDGP